MLQEAEKEINKSLIRSVRKRFFFKKLYGKTKSSYTHKHEWLAKKTKSNERKRIAKSMGKRAASLLP